MIILTILFMLFAKAAIDFTLFCMKPVVMKFPPELQINEFGRLEEIGFTLKYKHFNYAPGAKI